MSNNTHRPLNFYQLTVKCVGGEKYIPYLSIDTQKENTYIVSLSSDRF